MSSNPHNLKVGQEIWFESPYSTNPSRYVTIKSVGRKWALLDWNNDIRVNMDTLIGDIPNFSSHGRFYLSREEPELERKTSRALDDFKSAVGRLRDRDGITLEMIRDARKVLGMEENNETTSR